MGARRLAIAAAVAALLLLLVSAPAQAAPMVVLGQGGHSWRTNDRYVVGPAVTPTPAGPAAAPAAARASRAVTVRQVLQRLRARGTISAGNLRSLLGQLRAAEAATRRLRGTRAV